MIARHVAAASAAGRSRCGGRWRWSGLSIGTMRLPSPSLISRRAPGMVGSAGRCVSSQWTSTLIITQRSAASTGGLNLCRDRGRSRHTLSSVTATRVAHPAIRGVPGSSSGSTRTAAAMITRIATTIGTDPRSRGGGGRRNARRGRRFSAAIADQRLVGDLRSTVSTLHVSPPEDAHSRRSPTRRQDRRILKNECGR